MAMTIFASNLAGNSTRMIVPVVTFENDVGMST
jgi:hypothetical protein